MKKLLFVLLLFYPIHAYTQGWALEYSTGYGAYQLRDIRSLQESMVDNYGLKATDGFPDYITHSVSLGLLTEFGHFGGSFSYLTTGGRLHRADYSGSYTVDIIMNGYRLGAFYRYYSKTELPSLYLYLQLGSGMKFSSLEMDEQVNVYSESAQETSKLRGTGIYIEPTIGATYRLTNWLNFSLGGGYETDFLGTLKLSGQKTRKKAHWNGLRFYGGFTFILPTSNKPHNE